MSTTQDSVASLKSSFTADKGLLVFDYDGTLAHLDVDWPGLRSALVAGAQDLGFVSTFRPLWGEMSRLRDEVGMDGVSALLKIVADYEQRGVARQRRGRDVEEFVRWAEAHAVDGERSVSFAIFSANLHATVSAGLEALGLRSTFDWVVGADDVTLWKPDAEGLIRLMKLAGCDASHTLFIGDGVADEAAARQAHVDFVLVS